jgi:hypothetical protein
MGDENMSSAMPGYIGIPAPASLGMVGKDDLFEFAQNFTFGAAGTDNFIITLPIQFDAHFVCTNTMYSNNKEIGAAANGFVTVDGGAVVQISDASTQRALSNIQVPLNCLFGTAREPYIWPIPHVFRANGGITINITGNGAVMANAIVKLIFSGFKTPVSNPSVPVG